MAVVKSRGRPARISVESIVQAALAIVESEGFDALTARRVAHALQTSPMAIYRHVTDKDALSVMVLDAMYKRFPVPRLPRDPRKRLMVLFGHLHDALQRCPWVVHALLRSDITAPSVMPEMEAIMQAFADCGASDAEAVAGFRLVWAHIVGDVLTREVLERRAQGARSVVIKTIAALDARRFPAMARAARLWSRRPSSASFKKAMSALIDTALSSFSGGAL